MENICPKFNLDSNQMYFKINIQDVIIQWTQNMKIAFDIFNDIKHHDIILVHSAP